MTIAIQTTRIQDVYPAAPTAPVDASALAAVSAPQAGDGGEPTGEGGAGAWAEGALAETYKEAQRVAAMRDQALKQAAGKEGAAPPPVPIAVAPAAAIAPLVMPTAAEIAEVRDAARKRTPHHGAAQQTGSGQHVTEVAARFT